MTDKLNKANLYSVVLQEYFDRNRLRKSVAYAVTMEGVTLPSNAALSKSLGYVVTTQDASGDASQADSDFRPIYRDGSVPYLEFDPDKYLEANFPRGGRYTLVVLRPDLTFDPDVRVNMDQGINELRFEGNVAQFRYLRGTASEEDLEAIKEEMLSFYHMEPPVLINDPEISGIFEVNQTLTCSAGDWEYADEISFQWVINGEPIEGETSSTLILTVTHIGSRPDCLVTASNDFGNTPFLAEGEVVAATPAQLFADGQDGVWLDPSDHSTLWIDEERTQNATQPGDVVWWIDDKSGNENHFSVDASANRSRLVRWPASAVREGGPRNRLLNTDELTAPTWIKTNLSSVSQVDEPFGPAFMLTDSIDAGAVDHRIQTAGNTGSELAQNQVLLKAGTKRYVMLNHASSSDSRSRRIIVDLVDGTILQSITAEGRIEDAGNGWWRVSNFALDQDGATAARGFQVILLDGPDVSSWLYQGDGTGTIYVAQPLRLPTNVFVPGFQLYQRVGAGHWDVTEEGQPDCWGIMANGINNRCISERGIPEYVDGKVRVLVGQTKQRPDSIREGVLFTNQSASNTGNGYTVFAHLTAGVSYFARYRSSQNTQVDTGGEYPSPHTGALDLSVSSGEGRVSLRVNSDDPLTATGTAGGIGDRPMGLFGYLPSGGTFYEGILWSLILTAYAPDPLLWNLCARDWLNNTNMPGVLSDDD